MLEIGAERATDQHGMDDDIVLRDPELRCGGGAGEAGRLGRHPELQHPVAVMRRCRHRLDRGVDGKARPVFGSHQLRAFERCRQIAL